MPKQKCEWCEKGFKILSLDEDGVLTSLSNKKEKYQHAYDVYFWKCKNKRGSEKK